VTHHSTSSPIPLQGVIGIGLDLVGVVALGIAVLTTRIKARRLEAAAESRDPAPTAVG
jgi:hypothetical protein